MRTYRGDSIRDSCPIKLTLGAQTEFELSLDLDWIEGYHLCSSL